jgi:lysozyme
MGEKTISDKGLELIIKFEDFIKFPYKDPNGYRAIGYGNTYWEDGTVIPHKKITITQERAVELLKMTLKHYEKYVNTAATPLLNQNQFDALVSFCYDEGVQALRHSRLLKRVNKDKFDPEIVKEFYKFQKINNYKHAKKTLRRQMEIDLYFS